MSTRLRGSEVTLRFTVDGQQLEGSFFKVTEFSIQERGEITELSYLGNVVDDQDYQHHGFDFSFSIDVQDRNALKFLNTIVDRERQKLAHPVVNMVVIYAFRDGTATVETYQEATMRMTETSFGGRKEGVRTSFEGKCSTRIESPQ